MRRIDFALLVSLTLQQALRTFDVLGFRLHLHCLLDRTGRDDVTNLALETFDVPSSGGLIESIVLFRGLFQLPSSDFGSHRFLCKL